MKPVPQYEKPLYDAFSALQDTLLQRKNHRQRASAQQVWALYDDFLNKVHELSIVRKDEELKGMTLPLPTSTDWLIDDIWQLLTLSSVTGGLVKFAETYLALTTVHKLLTHLKECQVFSVDDLRPIKARLDEIRGAALRLDEALADAEDGVVDHRRMESLLLRNKLSKCRQVYDELEDTFEHIPADLDATYADLIAVRKLLLDYLTLQSDLGISDRLAELQAELKRIGAQRDALGKFPSTCATDAQLGAAQMVLNGLLDDCNNLVNDLSIQQDTLGITLGFALLLLDSSDNADAAATFAAFKQLYDELIALKLLLDKLLETRRWTMRETDLYDHQKLLKRIEARRVELSHAVAACTGAPLKKIKRAQLLVLYLLRRCYSLIYKLLESSEPVSETLQHIHNQLLTVRRCLLEIKRVDGLNNLRELYPFQFKLASLDNLRHDGKFIVNNQVPKGQGTLNALLAECFDIIHELQIELEEKEDEDDEQATRTDGNITDEEDKGSDDEVELKRNRYVGFHEADYDMASESEGEYSSESDSEFESNDYY